MAVKYVNSGASGANDGSSWTDAWTAIGSSTGVAAGDEVRVHKAHTQTGAIGTLNWSNGTLANPVKIFCVDKDASDALATGAVLSNNSGSPAFNGNIVWDGITFTITTGSMNWAAATDNLQRLRNCTLNLSSSGTFTFGGTRGCTLLSNSNIDMSGSTAAASNLGAGAGAVFFMRGGTITLRTGAGNTTTLFAATGSACRMRCEGVNITGTCTNLATLANGGSVELVRCILPTYTNRLLATPGTNEFIGYILLERCVAGTLSVGQLGLSALENRVGVLLSDLTKYRTGGADDGIQANAHSWSMAANANALANASFLYGLPMPVWVGTGSKTIKVYVASAVTLNDDEFGIDVLSSNETASPNTTSQGRFQSTRLADRGTPAALTTDGTSTWTGGAAVATKQYATVTINQGQAGPVLIRPWLALASTTVYVDPKPDVA